MENVKDDLIGRIAKTVFVSLLTSFVIIGILYYFKLRLLEDFARNSFFLFFAVLSYALIMPSIKEVRAFGRFPCMSGMMIGMTIGMLAGFLPGFFVGATNGMFWGSVFGMAVGIAFGAWNGKCCGVMGFMEGTMAGFMGGLMGAMTSIMMYNDNIKVAGVIVFGIGAVIAGGLHFMLQQESKGAERKKDGDFFTIVVSFVLTIITIWLMFFGPRSALFQ